MQNVAPYRQNDFAARAHAVPVCKTYAPPTRARSPLPLPRTMTYGVGAGASHLLYGHGRAHEELEAALARFTGYPRALCFSTGYMANIGVISALCTREDAVFADKLNHASLNDAMLLSRARFHRY